MGIFDLIYAEIEVNGSYLVVGIRAIQVGVIFRFLNQEVLILVLRLVPGRVAMERLVVMLMRVVVLLLPHLRMSRLSLLPAWPCVSSNCKVVLRML